MKIVVSAISIIIFSMCFITCKKEDSSSSSSSTTTTTTTGSSTSGSSTSGSTTSGSTTSGVYQLQFSDGVNSYDLKEGNDGILNISYSASGGTIYTEGAIWQDTSGVNKKYGNIYFSKKFTSTPSQTQLDNLYKIGKYTYFGINNDSVNVNFNYKDANGVAWRSNYVPNQTGSSIVVKSVDVISDPDSKYKVTGTITCKVASSPSGASKTITGATFTTRMGTK